MSITTAPPPPGLGNFIYRPLDAKALLTLVAKQDDNDTARAVRVASSINQDAIGHLDIADMHFSITPRC